MKLAILLLVSLEIILPVNVIASPIELSIFLKNTLQELATLGNEIVVIAPQKLNKKKMSFFQEENNFFPVQNAHYSNNWNPYHDVNSEGAPLSLFGSESPTGPYAVFDNQFLHPDYRPGTITLGRGREFDLATVEHEARGHGLQGGADRTIGETGTLPLEKDLLDLVKT